MANTHPVNWYKNISSHASNPTEPFSPDIPPFLIHRLHNSFKPIPEKLLKSGEHDQSFERDCHVAQPENFNHRRPDHSCSLFVTTSSSIPNPRHTALYIFSVHPSRRVEVRPDGYGPILMF